MWSRGRLDLSWSDVLSATFFCANPFGQPGEVEARIAEQWQESAFPARSVRSALDLILRTADWPSGSDVLLSAVTVPDVPRLIRIAGHRPVPLDIDDTATGFSVADVGERLTAKTKAIIVAPLFGSRCDLRPLRALADDRGLLLVEDAAQAWDGSYGGDPNAHVSLFSFGPIKTATALGGAVAVMRCPDLFKRTHSLQQGDPVEARRKLLARVCRFAALKAVSGRVTCSLLRFVLQATGRDFDVWVNDSMRGFGSALPADATDEERQAEDARLLQRLRCRLSLSQLKLLDRRLRCFSSRRLQRHTQRCREFAASLPASVRVPWSSQADRVFWTFPVVVERPRELTAFLIRHGYDATMRHRLCTVAESGFPTQLADRMMSSITFLPVYPPLSDRAMTRLGELITQFETQT